MADNTGAVKPADFHATSEKAQTPAVIAETRPAADAAGEEIAAKDFHATTEPLAKPADFHATDEKA
ncbi:MULTISPECIES: hypothetical protein [Streptomyces]|uniref:hypothetical protein n=1 Tax=Streptomyces TaxID=1883 RepID=UPI00211A0363|nr:hypothetical protein [Streptomyces hilarionis]MCQ9135163.1 hypothetical protein [Streptomyces hilarionis]